MKYFVVISAIFMMLAVQFGSCSNNTLFVDFTNDSFPDRFSKIEAEFDKNGSDIEFNSSFLNNYIYTYLESASSFDSITWNGAGPYNEFWKVTANYDESRKYRLDYDRALAPESQKSPCQRIANTNDTLCLFRLRIHYSGSLSTRDWMPIYLRVNNPGDKQNRSLFLYGGSYKLSNGHILNYDAYMADKMAGQLSFSMENVTTANEPLRTLVAKGINEKTFELVSQIKPQFIYFQCPKFSKLVPFTQQEIFQRNTTINLAHLGIPFDTNMTCSYSIFFTDSHNEMNLIQIKGKNLFSVHQNPRSLEWEKEERDELKRENNKLVVKYNDLVKSIKNVLDAHPMVVEYNDLLKSIQNVLDAHPMAASRSLVARHVRALVGRVFRQ